MPSTGRNGLKWALKTFPDRPVIYVLGNLGGQTAGNLRVLGMPGPDLQGQAWWCESIPGSHVPRINPRPPDTGLGSNGRPRPQENPGAMDLWANRT
jgi:hypothetical protein